jgi:hypothetical protein
MAAVFRTVGSRLGDEEVDGEPGEPHRLYPVEGGGVSPLLEDLWWLTEFFTPLPHRKNLSTLLHNDLCSFSEMAKSQ